MYLTGKPQLSDPRIALPGWHFISSTEGEEFSRYMDLYLHLAVSPQVPLSRGNCRGQFIFFIVNLTPSLRLLPILTSALAIILLCRVLRCLQVSYSLSGLPETSILCFFVSLFVWLINDSFAVCVWSIGDQTRYSGRAVQRVCDISYLHSIESRIFVRIWPSQFLHMHAVQGSEGIPLPILCLSQQHEWSTVALHCGHYIYSWESVTWPKLFLLTQSESHWRELCAAH